MVIAPGKFVETAGELGGGESISWVSVDAECVIAEPAWKAREMRGDRVECVTSVRAPMIGRMGLAALAAGEVTDPHALDAEYRRPSGAGVFREENTRPGPRE